MTLKCLGGLEPRRDTPHTPATAAAVRSPCCERDNLWSPVGPRPCFAGLPPPLPFHLLILLPLWETEQGRDTHISTSFPRLMNSCREQQFTRTCALVFGYTTGLRLQCQYCVLQNPQPGPPSEGQTPYTPTSWGQAAFFLWLLWDRCWLRRDSSYG